MKNLIYNASLEVTNVNAEIKYKEFLPKIVKDLALKILTFENEFSTIDDYILHQKIRIGSGIYQIIYKAFFGFEELLKSPKANLALIIKNGYLEKQTIISGTIFSLKPIINKFNFKVEDKNFIINNQKEMPLKMKNFFAQKNEVFFDIEVIKINYQISETRNQRLSLRIANQQLIYQDQVIDPRNLDLAKLISDNNLKYIENLPITRDILQGYHFLKNDYQENHLTITQEYAFDFLIKDASIEFRSLYNWKNLTIFKEEVVRKEQFSPNQIVYQKILQIYQQKNIEINQFIFLAFLKNELPIRKQLLKNQKNIENLIINKDFLRNILLIPEKIILNYNLDLDYVSKVLQRASIEQIPLIIQKLTIRKRDQMLDLKLIKRLSGVNPKYLSPAQKSLWENEVQKQALLKKSYFSIIGEITSLGIREKIKGFSKKQLKVIGGKNTKRWLDKNIGHNKGDFEITMEILNKAKRILNNFKKTIGKQNEGKS